jgi:dCMP deaminase
MTQLAWDCYFLKIGKMVSTNSKCLSRKIGAVLVRDNSIISTGYNGTARGVVHCNDRPIEFYETIDIQSGYSFVIRPTMEEGVCPRKYMGYGSGQGLHLCQAGHAERNALLQAGRNGISTKNTTLYCYCGQICKDCAIEVVNAGVKTLVYLDDCPEYDRYSKIILTESGIEIRKVKQELL